MQVRMKYNRGLMGLGDELGLRRSGVLNKKNGYATHPMTCDTEGGTSPNPAFPDSYRIVAPKRRIGIPWMPRRTEDRVGMLIFNRFVFGYWRDG